MCRRDILYLGIIISDPSLFTPRNKDQDKLAQNTVLE